MPGANYMGGRRNAAKARVKDTTGRLEKTFFGQRRLYALSKGLLASKPTQQTNVPPEEKLGLADISLNHARQKIPPNDVSTNSFVPNPIHISPCTPRSRRHTRKKLEAHSSSSNISKSALLDALDVSEPMFLRGVLDRILTIPDLAGISRNQKKPTVGTGIGGQPQTSDKSSPLQRTKRKRSRSDLFEESDPLSNERPSSSVYVQSHGYKNVCTPPRKEYTGFDHKIVHKERTRGLNNMHVEDDYWENISRYHQDDYNMELTRVDLDQIYDDEISEVANGVEGDAQSSPWYSRDYMSSRYSPSPESPSSKYAPYPSLDSREMETWNEWHTGLPTSIVFRSFKDGSAKRSMVMTTSVEGPTVYGTLFEQTNPWNTIGRILGLSNTKSLNSPGEVIDEPGEIDERIKTEVDSLECTSSGGGSTGAAGDHKSVLIIPELQELDGLFMGPSLFDELENEEEV